MSLAIIEQHRSDLTALRALAAADLASVVALIRNMDVGDARELLKEAIPDLMDPFMGAASDLGAVLLDELYAQAGRRPPVGIPEAPLLDRGRVDRLSRWAVTPMVDESLDSTVLSRLSGAATKMIFESANLTTIDGVTRHESGQRIYFQRIPRANACAFCQLLASRPMSMAYRSEQTAGAVVGRGSTRTGVDAFGNRLSGGVGGGIRTRGSQDIGEKYHDACRCVSVPANLGGPVSEAVRETRKRYEDMYAEVASENSSGARDLTATLKKWREVHGGH